MIKSVEVAGFQSLRRARFSLGWFTVITGRTGSGKSALVRALDLLASNARGTSYITRGEKASSVTMVGDESELTGSDDPWTVVVHRTAVGKGDQYKMQARGETLTFTKLAGKVPDQVSALLRISPLNFARQFDRPYLLDASGGDVARVLGRLTNVTLVFRAAGEAERRRRATLAELRTRRSDLDRLVEQARQYENLPAQKNAVETAELAVRHAAEHQGRITRLDYLSSVYASAAGRLAQVTVPPEPPPLERLTLLGFQLSRLAALDRAGATTSAALLHAEAELRHAEAGVIEVKDELSQYMAQWDVCPTCGQRVRKD